MVALAICQALSFAARAVSPSQNWAPEGNGVHFMIIEVVSGLLFSEESDGSEYCLKTIVQHAHLGPRVGQKIKIVMF